MHVITDIMKQDPFSGAVFMFCNNQRKHLKLIWWDTNGFWIAQKILERGRWPCPDTYEEAKEIKLDEVIMLLKESISSVHMNRLYLRVLINLSFSINNCNFLIYFYLLYG